MKFVNKWFNTEGESNDIAVSTRIRFARNVEGYAFGNRLTDDKGKEIIDSVSGALTAELFENETLSKIDIKLLPIIEAHAMAEQHAISSEFASADKSRALITNENGSVSVMVNEEDHIRIQSLTAGFDLDSVFNKANEIDSILDKKVKYAFDERLGYLTHCPTNLGTGMRASVMLHLPALTLTGSIQKVLVAVAKLGVAVRGLYGEGSDAEGAFYQISNQKTMDITEKQTVERLKNIINQLIQHERSARDALLKQNKDKLFDRIYRSYGTLKYARLINTKEFMQCISDVRLGVALGVIEGLTFSQTDALVVKSQPANVMLSGEDGSNDVGDISTNPEMRDKLRADLVRASI